MLLYKKRKEGERQGDREHWSKFLTRMSNYFKLFQSKWNTYGLYSTPQKYLNAPLNTHAYKI
jgi:hypothetical protein